MSTHPGMLLAYTATGDVVATLDHCVQYDENGAPLGLVNFAAHEEAGGELMDVWQVAHEGDPVKGSKTWPEWLGSAALTFRVELEGPPGSKHIKALVHKVSGHRRERSVIESAIRKRIKAAGDQPADIRDLVGGPDRPLNIDPEGRTAPRAAPFRPSLPLLPRLGAEDSPQVRGNPQGR